MIQPLTRKVSLLTGSANPQLAERIGGILDISCKRMSIEQFPDGEINPSVTDPMAGSIAVLVQPTSPPVNEHLVELILSIDALIGAGVSSVIAVVPYFGYARQCKRAKPGDSLSAQVVARMIERAGPKAIIALDLHEPTISRFVDIPFLNVRVEEAVANYIDTPLPIASDGVIVAPDRGREERARFVAERLGLPVVVPEKRRENPKDDPTSIVRKGVIGFLNAKSAIIVDDMVTTGNTLVAAIHVLKREGAEVVGAVYTHGILCDKAMKRLIELLLSTLVLSDSILFLTLQRYWTNFLLRLSSPQRSLVR